MKPSPITCLFNGQPHSLYGIYRLVFTISHHLYGTSHYLPWGEDSVDTLNQWGPLPTFYYSRPQSPFLWALLLALYGACCLLSVGFAACFLWDLLPAFCRTQSTSSGTHFYIVMETTLFYGARCLPSLGLAACFLWESLPVSHEPPPACFHRPGHPIAWTNVRPHPAPLAHQFPAWLLSSLQLRCSGLHPFLGILLSS